MSDAYGDPIPPGHGEPENVGSRPAEETYESRRRAVELNYGLDDVDVDLAALAAEKADHDRDHLLAMEDNDEN